MKICRLCLVEKSLSEFYMNKRTRDGFFHECKSCIRQRRRESHLKRAYGMTQQEHDRLLLSQHGQCAICGGKGKIVMAETRWRKALRVNSQGLYIDHDHKTGQVRGLLCPHCNTALGHFQDNPDLLMAAFAYLLMRKSAAESRRVA